MAFIFRKKKSQRKNEQTESVYIALYEFTATRRDELTFSEGDELELLSETDGGWWKARNKRTNQEGFVPFNFIQRKSSDVKVQDTEREDDSPKYVALYDYETPIVGYLSFKRGDKMTLLEATYESWWKMKLQAPSRKSSSDPREGYVPCNYIAALENLRDEPWFCGKVSRAEVIVMLTSPQNTPGSFLVRESESADGYSLSVLDKTGDVKHYRIKENDERQCFVVQSQVFGGVKELVEHYLHSDDSPGRLKMPSSPPSASASAAPASAAPAPASAAPSQGHCSRGTSAQSWEIERSALVFGKKLGSGQFGEVVQARWNNQIDVAIKTMKADSTERKEFLKEAESMQRLRHPRLVKLYGICTMPLDKPMLIVVELVRGGSLLDHLRKKRSTAPHTKRELVAIGAQVASGMAYLESEQVIHRDLAARNVLVDNDGKTVKIADFGLARIMQDNVYRAISNIMMPIKWTAPEAIQREHFTTKSDVWSYGILLYEVITHGHVPYPGMSNKEVVEGVSRGYRMPQPSECPDQFYKIMTDCWHERPDDRPSFAHLKGRMNFLQQSIEDS
ncbi:tyrosine-protein kinase Src42A-like isoform X2 [Penaeus japonicus]|uniref:tyrosine-protein kinase Src42A-like isoform X2 n=1 Tax=Penaeus japonicus TaxID=27405 RepID=UPI001C70E6A6|nr:tyrosine-protein kinase Src42A-like isoform X2 [Penaeus japonicus]